MKLSNKLVFLLLLCLALSGRAAAFISASTAQNQPDQQKVNGIWQGTLKVPGGELRIVFKISQKEDGTLTAAMDSPDQGASDIPVSNVTFNNDSLRIESNLIRGVYNGHLQLDNLTIKGFWTQGGMTFPLDIKRVEEAPTLNRPQEPKPPYPYLEEDVTVRNESARIELAGTFTRPSSGGPFPSIILISGSGPQDRNETIFGHRPFLVMADYLTRQGIAVLRIDDRGVGKSGGDCSKATSRDFASDVLAGINYLKTRTEVNPKQIGLIGHSEGGIIAPMVAAKSTDVAFIVLMAGTGLTGEEILYQQSDLIARADGASDSAIMKNRQSQQQLFAIVKQEKDDSVAAVKLRSVIKETINQLSEAEKKALGNGAAYINAQVQQLIAPWFRFFLTYDPKTALMELKCPILAINGELDRQVPPKENLTAIEQTLNASGNANYTIKKFPQLNHLFQVAVTGSPNEYAKLEETISPAVLKFIGDWILALVSR